MSAHSPRNKPAALGVLLASSREAAARYAGTVIDREQWRRIVGERIAARTEPGAKRGRELTVHVASASWAQELSLLVNEIVVRLKAAGVSVDTVRFRVREIVTPTRDAAALRPTYRKAALPSSLLEQLERIEDPELCAAIGEAAALWLALDDSANKATPVEPPKVRSRSASSKPPPTSALPSVRSPRDAELQSARSVRTSKPAPARPKGKP